MIASLKQLYTEHNPGMDKINSHRSSILTERNRTRKYIQRKHLRHNTYPRKMAETHSEMKIEQNCTSHSNLTYKHIVKITFVIFIVPYRYLNTC